MAFVLPGIISSYKHKYEAFILDFFLFYFIIKIISHIYVFGNFKGEKSDFLMVKNLLKPIKTLEKPQTKTENEFEAIKLRKTETVDDKSQLKVLDSNIEKENEFCKVKLRKTESLTNNEKENQSSKSKFRKRNCQNKRKENILSRASVNEKKSLEIESPGLITDVTDRETENINLELIKTISSSEVKQTRGTNSRVGDQPRKEARVNCGAIYLFVSSLNSPDILYNSRTQTKPEDIFPVFSNLCLFCWISCDDYED